MKKLLSIFVSASFAAGIAGAQNRALMGSNPGNFQGDNLPVENVTWFDAVHFCNARSAREGLTPAYTINGETVI